MISRLTRALLITLLFSSLRMQVGFTQASTSTLEQLEVAFWPEYDQPAVLVIYRFRLPENTPLPSTLQIGIPARVGEPHAVAYRSDETGELLNADFELEVIEDWANVTIQMDGFVGQLEYYDTLSFQGDERSFVFEWRGGLQVGQFSYELQQPFGAEQLSIDPPSSVQVVGNDGLTYFRAEVGMQEVDSNLLISFDYSKSDPQLTLDALQQLPPLSPVDAPQDQAFDLQSLLPYLIGGIGLLLIGVGLFLYLRPASDRKRVTQPRKRSRKPKRSGLEVDASPLYCHECGTQAGSGDHYCRQCGTKLRR